MQLLADRAVINVVQALHLSQTGCHDDADLLLSALGCRFKLASPVLQPALWTPSSTPLGGTDSMHHKRSMHSTQRPLKLPIILDGLLSGKYNFSR